MAYLSSVIVFMFISSGLYLIMRRNTFEILLGTTLLAQGSFILLISMTGWSPSTQPPLVDKSKISGAPVSYTLQGELINDMSERIEHDQKVHNRDRIGNGAEKTGLSDYQAALVESEKAAQYYEFENREEGLAYARAKASLHADPLPQALILTAIVISFGVTAFLIVLVARGIQENESMDFGEMDKEEDEL